MSTLTDTAAGGNEYLLADNTTLMTTTDARGIITYANSSFAEVSGYQQDEIEGQPHNLVRHPDMPKQAFADMWATLKQGLPWSGLVKNRRKNGDFYWVRANVVPLIREKKIVGYMSVRVKPRQEEVTAAEQLYQQMRGGTLRRWRLHQGILLRTGLLKHLSALKTLPLRWRIRGGSGALWLLTLLSSLAAGVEGRALAISAGLSLIASLMVCRWLERQISRPMEKARAMALKVATGADTQVEGLDRVDEVGITLRAVAQQGLMFRWLINDVREQVMSVHQASDALSLGSEKIAIRTEQTAVSVQQTAAAMEQMTRAVAENTDSTDKANSFSLTVNEAALEGREAVHSVVSTMDKISASSTQIATTIGLIDSIAFQTNILALNAAVEAARAGEQGKGFAVVAGEVRSLANRSATAASEIRQLIKTSTLNVQAGAAQVREAGEAITEMVDKVQNVKALLNQISMATHEQGTGLSEVGKAIDVLDQNTRQNATLAETSVQAAAGMKNQAHRLVKAITAFS
ncbi:methyl-accepting chemotaxis protein [Winslowiella iniecta]|uniref:Aerotaxis receptor Aer n=1 Tax=Winslowiella iniecta TaxID=1560201 RepID=A0A0L7TEV1_9GAMM|nr:PAS domain-containing methyl-accepting chemotaxis protein [Winslowiella iniecta]KOC89571.1 aerotaxis receptor Aer [Winslowiella iniecta]KOC93875.1 aerotaxis receptor Aer [Winslowiella iniecta]